jgi:hypothetical protein
MFKTFYDIVKARGYTKIVTSLEIKGDEVYNLFSTKLTML